MMILTKTIFVKITGIQIKYYNDLGYKCKALDIIEIKVEDLSKGSSVLIDVRCDKCGYEKSIIYNQYLKNIKNGGYYSCRTECSRSKTKATNLEKYGVEYASQSKENNYIIFIFFL